MYIPDAYSSPNMASRPSIWSPPTEAPSAPTFIVHRQEPELITPAAPTPREFKRLSNIDDQQGLRSNIPIFQFYNSNADDRDPVAVIRDALARALVFYYPLAGRLRETAGRKLVVDCTAEGALFVPAYADVRLEDLGDTQHPPFPFFGEVLHDVPGSGGLLDCPLVLMQMTRLRCRGFIVATRFNHTLVDGAGIGQFLNAVAELARGAASPSVLPVWARELLEARCPPRITCAHPEYDDAHGAAVAPDFTPAEDMVHRSVFIRREDIAALRKLVPDHLSMSSTFEILTACLWRCRTAAIGARADDVVRVMFTVNARGGRCSELGLPRGFYGNAIVYAAALSTAGELCSRPVGYALELMRKVKEAVTAEYVRSVADLMVLRGRPHYVTAGSYLVSDGTRTKLEEIDYGWGRPVYGGPAWGRVASFHLPFRNSKGEEGIVVPHYLPRSTMEKFGMEVEKLIRDGASMGRSCL